MSETTASQTTTTATHAMSARTAGRPRPSAARSSPATTWAARRCAARWTRSSPQLAVRRPRQRAGRAQHLHHHPRRRSARAGRPHRGRRASRLPQRLPPPRLRAADRRRQVQAGDPLPLPRLDLRLHRRAPDGRARASQLRRARQVEAGPDARAGRDPGRLRVRQPRRRGEAAGRAHRGARRAARALPDRRARDVRRQRAAAAASPPTGRSSSRTTSRATTCRSPIRA